MTTHEKQLTAHMRLTEYPDHTYTLTAEPSDLAYKIMGALQDGVAVCERITEAER